MWKCNYSIYTEDRPVCACKLQEHGYQVSQIIIMNISFSENTLNRVYYCGTPSINSVQTPQMPHKSKLDLQSIHSAYF